MGSCCCSCEEMEEEAAAAAAPELQEQETLLEPPGKQDRSSMSESYICQEEAILASILAKAASSIIDIAAAQTQRLGPHECVDRARLYHSRLAKLNLGPVLLSGGDGVVGSYNRPGGSSGSGGSGGGFRRYWKKKGPPSTPLPSLTNHPHRVLAGAQVPYADVQEAIRITADAYRAMQHVRVQPQEDLVVQFEVV